MALEIEKKYLLSKLPPINYNETLRITQYYVGKVRYRMTYNIKTLETSFYETTKTTVSAGVNEEVENKISATTYWEKVDIAERIISKIRYIKKDKKIKWELDCFEDLTLIIAEVEVIDEKSLKTVKPPEWLTPYILLDVTEFKQFSNYNLAEKV